MKWWFTILRVDRSKRDTTIIYYIVLADLDVKLSGT